MPQRSTEDRATITTVGDSACQARALLQVHLCLYIHRDFITACTRTYGISTLLLVSLPPTSLVRLAPISWPSKHGVEEGLPACLSLLQFLQLTTTMGHHLTSDRGIAALCRGVKKASHHSCPIMAASSSTP